MHPEPRVNNSVGQPPFIRKPLADAVANAAAQAAFNPDGIPAELKAIPRWVLWKLVERNGKWTKPPYQANGKPAEVNDQSTWTTYELALAAYRAGGFSGIGVVLTEDDDLVGVDLDKCLNPDTGELDPAAAAIVAMLPTYFEISPSGIGLRGFCFGKLPIGSRRKGKIEMYDEARYLTVTGRRFNCHDSLSECTPELAQAHALVFGKPKDAPTGRREEIKRPSPVDATLDLDDETLLNKARNAKNGTAFDALWRGDISGHGDDHSAADLALCDKLTFWWNKDAASVDRLYRQSGLMRPKWDERHDEQTYGQITIAKAIADCRETYSGKSKPTGARLNESAEAIHDENPYRGTDDSNAGLFLKLHGSDVRFCPPWGKWLLWQDSHWQIDERMDIDRLAADVPRQLYRDAADAADSAKRREIADLARKLESTFKRSNMLAAAKHRVVAHYSDLDKDHFLLNASNGTVDLRTGIMRPHSRADLLTHHLDISHLPEATAPTWLAFLHDVFAGDKELIRFVQRAIGYSLTGDVREQILLICHGFGSNGKSVFLNILRKLLDKLALQAAPDLLMSDKNRRHPTEQADLFGKRAVICQETGDGRRFDETLVKRLTGGDGITARRMHEDNWTFEPTHTLWLSTNHKPEIRGTDHAIWRRIRLIPFAVTFTDDGPARKDPAMEEKLTAELPGILAWAVAGCLDWQRNGLGASEAVKAATTGYQQEMDVLATFIADCCILSSSAEVRASTLYRTYTEWCEQSGEHIDNQRKFGQRLSERGLQRFRNNGIRYRGIGLLAEGAEGSEPIYGIDDPELVRDPFISKKGSAGSVGSVNANNERVF